MRPEQDVIDQLADYFGWLETQLDAQPVLAPSPDRMGHGDRPAGRMPAVVNRRSRRLPAVIGSISLVAAASVGIFVLATRDPQPGGQPASTNSSATTVTFPSGQNTTSTWPVHLAAGLTPWYEANDPITAALGPALVEPAQERLECAQWTPGQGVVNCTALTGEGYYPAVGYHRGDQWVLISTLHADIDIAAYAHNYSQGHDVGYDAAPLPLKDVTVNGQPGKLVTGPNGNVRVTFRPANGTLVAVEASPGTSVEDLLTIASNVRPTKDNPAIPLVIAQSEPTSDGRRVTALGAVHDGELCLLTDFGCAPLSTNQPVLGQHTDNETQGLIGLVATAVAALSITHADGTTSKTDLTHAAPVGSVRAFAITLTAPNDVVVPLDQTGTPISLVGGSILTVPGAATDVIPTTAPFLVTP